MRFRRWEVETDIRHLKTTMKMEVLRSQTAAGVLKEVAVFGIVYNLVRAVMLASAARQKTKPTRLSFADALAWLRHAEPDHDWPDAYGYRWFRFGESHEIGSDDRRATAAQRRPAPSEASPD